MVYLSVKLSAAIKCNAFVRCSAAVLFTRRGARSGRQVEPVEPRRTIVCLHTPNGDSQLAHNDNDNENILLYLYLSLKVW